MIKLNTIEYNLHILYTIHIVLLNIVFLTSSLEYKCMRNRNAGDYFNGDYDYLEKYKIFFKKCLKNHSRKGYANIINYPHFFHKVDYF